MTVVSQESKTLTLRAQALNMNFEETFYKLSTLGWPWHPNSSEFLKGNDMRKRSRAARLSRFSAPQRYALQIISTILWPFGALHESLWVSRLHDTNVREGKLVVSGYSWASAFKAAIKYNIPPREYYIYQLCAADRAQDRNAYIYHHERLGLMLSLNRYVYTKDDDPIQDKLAFSKFCDRNSVPHPITLWHCASASTPDLLSETDLWVKPQYGSQGRENIPIKFVHHKQYLFGEKTLNPDELIRELSDLSRVNPVILQPLLKNHKMFSNLTNGGIVVVRLVSGKEKNGDVTPIAATIQFPTGAEMTAHSGIIATVNLQSGQMTNFRSPQPIYSPVTQHPDTGQIFPDMPIPDWNLLLELTTKLHKALKGYVFIGWDIAITPDGPVFLEGNSSWNAQQHQESAPKPAPLGRTALLGIAQSYWI